MAESPVFSTSQNTLRVLVLSPDMPIFNGEAFSVSSFNEKGPFDVLPQHKNFISLISIMVRIRFKDGKEKEIPIQGGVLRVYQNRTDIYLIPQPSEAR